jgi:hypothetical protein
MAARPSYLLFALAVFASACATGKQTEGSGLGSNRATEVERGPQPVLASSHCSGGTCVCRGLGDDRKEEPAPAAGKKRIEIRMSVYHGSLTLDSPTVGHFEHGSMEEACYYVDLDINTLYTFHLASKEAQEGRGVTPSVHISEYSVFGHYWYDIVDVTCGIGERSCDPGLARAWAQGWMDKRKRGRLDPCGSLVVVGLKWGTSGGQAEANGWALRDFNADFGLEVKKFATEFPPNARECMIGH